MSMAEEFDDDSLEADLAAALDAGKPVVEVPEGETAEQIAEREYARDEAGRFAQKQKEEAEAAAVDPLAAKPAEQAPKVWKPVWYKDEYGPWDKIGEPLRKALEQREKEVAQGIEKHSTAAKQWEPLNKALEPYQAQMQQAGITAPQYFKNLMDFDVKLYDPDPINRIDTLNALAIERTGYDLTQLGEWLAQNGPAPKPDPLKQELQQLKTELHQLKERPQLEARQRAVDEVEAWSKDKPHFQEVKSYMGALAQLPENSKATLDELYAAAMRAHPQLYTRTLEDQRRAEVQRARTAAAQSPRSGASNGSARNQRPTMSLEEEIGMHLDGAI